MVPAGLEPSISASQRPQGYTLVRPLELAGVTFTFTKHRCLSVDYEYLVTTVNELN
jgi:hypothetical protein